MCVYCLGDIFVHRCNELPTMQDIATLLGKPLNTVRDWVKKAGYKINKDTGKVISEEETENEN